MKFKVTVVKPSQSIDPRVSSRMLNKEEIHNVLIPRA